MIKNVCILNYGLGNILSLKNAISHLGFKNNFYTDMVKKNYDCLTIWKVPDISGVALRLFVDSIK